jgi:hypothetical protein
MHKPISLVTRAVALCALLILLPIALLAQGMTPEQVVSLRSVGATVLSPDGRWVAYTAALPRDTADERGGAFSELYVVAAAGGEPRAVITRPQGAASPQ